MDDLAGTSGFGDWFGEMYPQARSVALRILGSVPAAEDVAAEAMTRALVGWDRVGGLGYRDAWVLRVTTNLAIDVARKRRPVPAAISVPAGSAADLTVLRMSLVSALAALPRRQREAVVLRHLVGYPPAEVAEAMGVSTNSVKKHLQRGLDRLRRALPEGEGADLDLP